MKTYKNDMNHEKLTWNPLVSNPRACNTHRNLELMIISGLSQSVQALEVKSCAGGGEL